MSRADKPLVINARDRALFYFIGEHETASFHQLKARFWPDATGTRTTRDRLNKLCCSGYLARFEYWSDPWQQVYRYQLRPAALKALESGSAAGLYTGKKLSSARAGESLLGVAARLELEKSGFKVEGWVSGRRLLEKQARLNYQARVGSIFSSNAAVADGQALVRGQDGQLQGIDVEIQGAYYGRMLRDKVAGYSGRNIIWVTPAKHYDRVVRAATPNIWVIGL